MPLLLTEVVYFLLQVGLLLCLFLRNRNVYLGELSYLSFIPLRKLMLSGLYWNQPFGPSVHVKTI